MGSPLWLERLEQAPSGSGVVRPLAWLFRDDDPAVLRAAARCMEDDRRDAALARADGGAPRLLRRRLLRALAARVWNVHPDLIAFVRDEAGAVRIVAPVPACVSGGGREGWSVVALSALPIGADVETTAALPPDALEAWLRREALGKLHGSGLIAPAPADPPGAFSFRLRGPVTACVATL